MERKINILKDFPTYFFIFLTIFTAIKFIFIFFFRASYEPNILFELTPFHGLSGFNNLQLLLISLIIVFVDMYLHLYRTKKNIMYSFLFTGLLCSGIGLAIASREPVFTDVFHYIVFGCLLIIILIDHKQYLLTEDLTKPSIDEKPSSIAKSNQGKLRPVGFINYFEKYILNPTKFILSKIYRVVSSLKKPQKVKNKKIKSMSNKIKFNDDIKSKRRIKPDISTNRPTLQSLEDLDKLKLPGDNKNNIDIDEKTDRLLILEKKIPRASDFLKQDKKTMQPLKNQSLEFSRETTLSKKGDEDYQKIFDEIIGYAAVVQSGIIKQIKNSFARFLGYEIYELIDEKLTKFVSPESFYEIEKYYISKLKGTEPPGYEVKLLKKDKTKVFVKVKTKLININGKNAEIAIFKIIK